MRVPQEREAYKQAKEAMCELIQKPLQMQQICKRRLAAARAPPAAAAAAAAAAAVFGLAAATANQEHRTPPPCHRHRPQAIQARPPAAASCAIWGGVEGHPQLWAGLAVSGHWHVSLCVQQPVATGSLLS